MGFDFHNYEVLLPPYPLDFATWKEDKAKDYLKWFVSKIPERVDYLCWRYHKDNLLRKEIDPDDPESLKKIWKWFLPRARIEEKPKEAAEAQLAAFSYLGGRWLDTRQLSTCTEYVIRDIGMLFGHIFTTNYPQQLYWTTEKGVKGYIWRWHPVLKGFVYITDEKKAYPPLEPVHVVDVQGSKKLDNQAGESDLLNIYKYWVNQVPNI